MANFQHLGDELAHQGHIWRVVRAEFAAPDGQPFTRDIVRSPGAVAVVPLVIGTDGTPNVRLLSQYRPAYDRTVIEIPAGMRDIPGEPPVETGRRELVEEAGLAAGDMIHLLDLLPSPGMSDAVTIIYLAVDCDEVDADLQGPEELHMTVFDVTLADALTMIDRGEIADAKTVAGLLLTQRHLQS
ncbi:MAG TPA: NUDIX hydrolase [Ilumatobacter sp.]|nr:NUDIX hydrolase [Ilumatobacter sp.]